MKTLHPAFYVLMLAAPLLFSSCIGKLFGKDDDDVVSVQEINDRIQGDWEVTSWDIAGTEAIPEVIASFSMDFNDDGPNDGRVDWEIESNFQDIFESGTYLLEYEISDDGRQIEINSNDYDLTLDGDRMTLEGRLAGSDTTLKLRRD